MIFIKTVLKTILISAFMSPKHHMKGAKQCKEFRSSTNLILYN